MAKILSGVVVSKKCNKTLKVKILHRFVHNIYSKVINRYKHYLVHDESNEAKVGDVVYVKESRPISKNKSYILVKLDN